MQIEISNKPIQSQATFAVVKQKVLLHLQKEYFWALINSTNTKVIKKKKAR